MSESSEDEDCKSLKQDHHHTPHVPDLFGEENLESRLFGCVGSAHMSFAPSESYCRLKGPLVPTKPLQEQQNQENAQQFADRFATWKKSLQSSTSRITAGHIDKITDASFRSKTHVAKFAANDWTRATNTALKSLDWKLQRHPLGSITSSFHNLTVVSGSEIVYGDAFNTWCINDCENKAQRNAQSISVKGIRGIKTCSQSDETILHFISREKTVLRSFESDEQFEFASKDHILDSVILPTHRLVINATGSGKLASYDITTQRYVAETSCSKLIRDQWGCLQAQRSNLQRHMFIGTRKAVTLFDIRSNRKKTLFNFEGSEVLGDLCEPFSSDDSIIFGCTNQRVFQLDIRMPGSITELCHATDSTLVCRDYVPSGCAMFKKANLHYFAWFWIDGKIRIACLDKNYTQKRFPVDVGLNVDSWALRGIPCEVESALNYSYDTSESLINRIQTPLMGLQFLEKDETLQLYAVNAVGDLFETTLFNKNPDTPKNCFSWPSSDVDCTDVTKSLNEFNTGPKRTKLKIAKQLFARNLPDITSLTLDPIEPTEDTIEQTEDRSPSNDVFLPTLPQLQNTDFSEFDDEQDVKIRQVMNGAHFFETEDVFENTNRVMNTKGVPYVVVKRKSYLNGL